MSKCERKVVRKFALETEKLMRSLYPTDAANNPKECKCAFNIFDGQTT